MYIHIHLHTYMHIHLHIYIHIHIHIHQGLIQKQKVDIDGENSAQISIAAKNIVTHDDPKLWLWGPNKLYAILIFHFFILNVINIIKKLELLFLIVYIWPKIESRHAQIVVPKIGMLMLKIACINPCTHIHITTHIQTHTYTHM